MYFPPPEVQPNNHGFALKVQFCMGSMYFPPPVFAEMKLQELEAHPPCAQTRPPWGRELAPTGGRVWHSPDMGRAFNSPPHRRFRLHSICVRIPDPPDPPTMLNEAVLGGNRALGGELPLRE